LLCAGLGILVVKEHVQIAIIVQLGSEHIHLGTVHLHRARTLGVDNLGGSGCGEQVLVVGGISEIDADHVIIERDALDGGLLYHHVVKVEVARIVHAQSEEELVFHILGLLATLACGIIGGLRGGILIIKEVSELLEAHVVDARIVVTERAARGSGKGYIIIVDTLHELAVHLGGLVGRAV